MQNSKGSWQQLTQIRFQRDLKSHVVDHLFVLLSGDVSLLPPQINILDLWETLFNILKWCKTQSLRLLYAI